MKRWGYKVIEYDWNIELEVKDVDSQKNASYRVFLNTKKFAESIAFFDDKDKDFASMKERHRLINHLTKPENRLSCILKFNRDKRKIDKYHYKEGDWLFYIIDTKLLPF